MKNQSKTIKGKENRRKMNGRRPKYTIIISSGVKKVICEMTPVIGRREEDRFRLQSGEDRQIYGTIQTNIINTTANYTESLTVPGHMTQ